MPSLILILLLVNGFVYIPRPDPIDVGPMHYGVEIPKDMDLSKLTCLCKFDKRYVPVRKGNDIYCHLQQEGETDGKQ